MTRCKSFTRTGQRCKLSSINNGDYCRVHAIAAQPPPILQMPLVIPPDAIFNANDLAALLLNNIPILRDVLIKLRTFRDIRDAEYFVGAGVLLRVLMLVQHADPSICDAALWVLINFTTLPGDFASDAIVRLGGLRILYTALMTPHIQTHKNALWCLSNMAGSSKKVAESMIVYRIHTLPSSILISPITALDSRRQCAVLFSNFSKYMDRDIFFSVIQTLSNMPVSNMMDNETMSGVLWGLERCAKRFTSIGTFPIRVVFDHLREGCVLPALEIVTHLSSSTDQTLIRSMVDLGILQTLHKMFRSNTHVDRVAFAMSNLACDIPDLFLTQQGLLFDIIHSLENRECLWTLCNLLSKFNEEGCVVALRKGALLRLSETLCDDKNTLNPKQINVILEGIQHLFTKSRDVAMLHARICDLGSTLHMYRDDSTLAPILLELYETFTMTNIGVY